MAQITLGGALIEVEHPETELIALENTRAFAVSSNEPADVKIKVLKQHHGAKEIAEFKASSYLFETETAWAIAEFENEYHFGPVEQCNFDPMLPHVRLSKDFNNITCYSVEDKLMGTAYPLDEIIADHYFALNDGIIVHASGLNINENGILFLGDSGAGKSTIAEYFVDAYGDDSILCDDRMIIRKVNGQWMIYGSPWHGTFHKVSPQGIPLKGMYFIEQAEKNQNLKVDPSETFERLTRVSFICWWLESFSSKQLKTIQDLVMDESIETNILEFKKDPSIVEFLNPSII